MRGSGSARASDGEGGQRQPLKRAEGYAVLSHTRVRCSSRRIAATVAASGQPSQRRDLPCRNVHDVKADSPATCFWPHLPSPKARHIERRPSLVEQLEHPVHRRALAHTGIACEQKKHAPTRERARRRRRSAGCTCMR